MQSISISGLLFWGGGLGGYQSRVNLVSYLKTPTIAHFFLSVFGSAFLGFYGFSLTKTQQFKDQPSLPPLPPVCFFWFLTGQEKKTQQNGLIPCATTQAKQETRRPTFKFHRSLLIPKKSNNDGTAPKNRSKTPSQKTRVVT